MNISKLGCASNSIDLSDSATNLPGCHKLILDNYSGGVAAPYQSWVLLEKVTAE